MNHVSPKNIQISSLPSFSVDKISTKAQDEIRKREKIVGSIIGFLIIAGITTRILSGIAFDKKLSQDHDKMDNAEVALRDLERIAFKDNNYKKPEFKKSYFETRDAFRAIKKEHLSVQNYHFPSIIWKSKGVCPKCLEDQNYRH